METEIERMHNLSRVNDSSFNMTDLNENSSQIINEVRGLVSLVQRQNAKYVLFFFILPIIAVVGIVGNSMSLSILRTNKTGYAFNVYLMALTSADVLLLVIAFSRSVMLMIAKYPDVVHPALDVFAEYYISVLFGGYLQRVSSTLISVIAIERFAAVLFPFKVKDLVIENHPVKVVIGIFVGQFVTQIPTVILITVNSKDNPLTNSTTYFFDLRIQTEAAETARQAYLVFLAIIGMFIPLIIVSLSTISVLICLKLRSRRDIFGRGDTRDKDRETMTITLTGMASIFTLCYIPITAIYLLAAIDEEIYKREILLIYILVDVNIISLCLNSASDFVIYFWASKGFRRLFIRKYFPCLINNETGSTNFEGSFAREANVSTVAIHDSVETSVSNVSDAIEL